MKNVHGGDVKFFLNLSCKMQFILYSDPCPGLSLAMFLINNRFANIRNAGRNVGIDVRAFCRRGTGRLQSFRGDNGEGGRHVAAGREFGTLASASTRKVRVVPHRAKSERYPRGNDELRRVSNSGKKEEIV